MTYAKIIDVKIKNNTEKYITLSVYFYTKDNSMLIPILHIRNFTFKWQNWSYNGKKNKNSIPTLKHIAILLTEGFMFECGYVFEKYERRKQND